MTLTEEFQITNRHTGPLKESHVSIPDGFFVNWFKARGRSFPWREEGISPFGILLAEVLLKQTRAEMVALVWPTLFRKYPNASSLEAASSEVLQQHISCLGFGLQRVTALRQLSVAINEAGGLPSLPTDLMNLPYVGVYSAHAVACFAFGHRVPVVDLGIVRVLSRLAGIESPSDIRRAPEIWKIAWSIMPREEVKEHNYGLLDFAADICKASAPRCTECPVAIGCARGKHLSLIGEQNITLIDP